jgi:hypothetical protein
MKQIRRSTAAQHLWYYYYNVLSGDENRIRRQMLWLGFEDADIDAAQNVGRWYAPKRDGLMPTNDSLQAEHIAPCQS